MSERYLVEISSKLDAIIKLLAVLVVREEQTLKRRVAVLSSLGFQPKQIATILGKKPHLIRQTLYKLRKEMAESTKSEEDVSG